MLLDKRGGGTSHLQDTLTYIAEDRSKDVTTGVIVMFLGSNDMDAASVNV